MEIDLKKCNSCGICVQDCPLGSIRFRDKRPFVEDSCTRCGACVRICPEGAMALEAVPPYKGIQCDACPIVCLIRDGFPGACHRYRNEGGELVRITPLHPFDQVEEIVGPEPAGAIRRPLITGIGAGTTYPDCKPAPFIVKGRQRDVDVVTVVTEAPLSYSSIMVKIDTDLPVGDEGAPVMKGKRKVGLVTTEQYGSKMLSIGGVNLLTGKDGLLVAKTITDIANRKLVKLRIEGGSKLEFQIGEAPVINGRKPDNMRVGCGSATLGLFAPLLKESADEVIVLDSHITGLMSEHAAGRFAGTHPSGVRLKYRMSTPGRYFGDHGDGWGGTSITDPGEIIAGIDPKVARPGMRILITETTGQKAILFELGKDGRLREIPATANVERALKAISSSCEPSMVSALYVGGAGGSARAGVSLYPVKLTRAVHAGRANLTVGGAPVYLLPGGGINFMVDVGRVKRGSFYWSPTPATICPIEYTMELIDYEEMGGHMQAMKPFSSQEPVSPVD
ncbi:MAG: 4Fe-4S binding protein [Proteobacteria bacterium]|nr:4Fe-4S binding protein [Pseudomonadota bacterium]